MAVSKSPEFEKAVAESSKLKAKPKDDDLLQLYALFKIGEGNDFQAASKPGMFDLKGKYKYGAWQKEAEAGTTAEEAQKKYVELVEKLKGEHGFEG